jgi:hypothetical protein
MRNTRLSYRGAKICLSRLVQYQPAGRTFAELKGGFETPLARFGLYAGYRSTETWPSLTDRNGLRLHHRLACVRRTVLALAHLAGHAPSTEYQSQLGFDGLKVTHGGDGRRSRGAAHSTCIAIKS